MNRIVYFEAYGKKYPLAFTLKAQEEMEERFGGFANIEGKTGEIFQIFELFLQCGQRRLKQLDDVPIEPVDIEDLKDIFMPSDFPNMIDAITKAIKAGQENEVKGEPTSKKNEAEQ